MLTLNQKRKNSFIISIGSLLEYYEFIIFGLLSPYLAKNFFNHYHNGLLITYLLFASGYLFRPIGGIILGAISDVSGRKAVFSMIVLLSGFSTLLMGLLPTSTSFISISIFLLIVLRITQSIGFGAEIPNAVTIMYELEGQNRGFRIASVILNATIGALLAMLSIYVLTSNLSSEQMLSYGWRIPFFIGGIFSFVIFYLRRSVSLIQQSKKRDNKVWKVLSDVFKKYKSELVLCFTLILPVAVFNIFNIFLPAYLSKFHGYEVSEIYLATTIGLILCLFVIFISGKLVNRCSYQKFVGSISIVMLMALIYVCFYSPFESMGDVYIFIISYTIYDCALAVIGLNIATKIFKVNYRNTGVAFCYNISFLLASFVPTIVIKVTKLSENPIYFLYILMFIVILACASSISLLIKSGVK